MEENQEGGSEDVLVVVSKLKKYIRDKSQMNTAGGVPGSITRHVKVLCDRAIENARRDGRKTVMERDFD